ncbi:ribosomal-protein-alanine acetyltransferase [Vibrio sinaloensis DSM 21326]|uniref:[Ribosomal protein bS18]-alanine N-acetyltransferase n=1 Tax=Vibrio sinaloensis DSM 21326 TaxID=945550 RepID=E8M743_PHOS4|nr:ribosomal protein S18-alanine N-acetyltransferase [Vibrio sinaloensis]EGA70115.1 ribosomal-protein-alanine acetyltransferase [Vibrio sinaloensis DSM 21326]
MIITPLAKQHLEQVYRIECLAHSHPWSESLIGDINSRGAFHHVMLEQDKVVGYFYAQNIVGEVTLLNIAVDPTLQGKGYGKALLTALVEMSEQQRAESIWLEVRESNRSAFGLYQTIGFNEVDRRINYYPTQSGKEDAIIMSYLLL